MFYIAAKALFSALFSTVFRWRVGGRENVPERGPVLLCSNHISWWDPPLVGCGSPRRVYFMAKEELFSVPFLGRAIRALGAFPVRRGMADRSAVRSALEHLRAGRVVGMFPEGTRSRKGTLGRAEPGAALLALKSGATVVPVAIRGPYRVFRPVRITFGRPLALADLQCSRPRSGDLARAGERIMEAIADLLDDGGGG